ncbi:MAG: peptidase M19 [Ponticaulis sp.]|nr:peptidase M19 [Ponticaulis sp.]|tara:strand:- start:17246 stop:18511 length:1266 start_codon:yes stop_codon:yes gene_type:complete
MKFPNKISQISLTALAALALSACETTTTVDPTPMQSPFDANHQALVILDTHLDTPALLVQPWFDITERHDYFTDYTQVDLPRMDEGGLDGGFWVLYTPQGPLTEDAYEATRDVALLRAMSVQKMVAANPEEFEIAKTADDAWRIGRSGKKVVIMSIENSYPLGTDLSLVETFYKLGVRMIGPVHSRNNQFADSATEIETVHDGLSPLGYELVEEANRLGMVVDGSHASQKSLADMISASKTPVVLSHSGTSAVYMHPRNIDDEHLKMLADSGGVIQMNALGAYLRELPANPERTEELMALRQTYSNPGDMTSEQYDEYLAARNEIDAKYPPAMAEFEDFYDQLTHALRLIGPDHVGIGPDWDGGGGVIGLEDVSDYPAITQRLRDDGYSWDDIQKIMGGNVLRLLAEAEAYAASLKDGSEG